jgi:hypothetical protein
MKLRSPEPQALNNRPKELAERAREMAERREREADAPATLPAPPQLKVTAAHYRALAQSLEHQRVHIQALRERLERTIAERSMLRDLAGEDKKSA